MKKDDFDVDVLTIFVKKVLKYKSKKLERFNFINIFVFSYKTV
jgi:hypothetical protein